MSFDIGSSQFDSKRHVYLSFFFGLVKKWGRVGDWVRNAAPRDLVSKGEAR